MASLVFIACNAVYKPVITRPLMEVTYSLVCFSHHSTTVLFTFFSIISHLRITDQTDSITTVITLTITKITRYLKLNIYTFSLRCNCFFFFYLFQFTRRSQSTQCKISIDFFQNHKQNISNILTIILKIYIKSQKVLEYGFIITTK